MIVGDGGTPPEVLARIEVRLVRSSILESEAEQWEYNNREE